MLHYLKLIRLPNLAIIILTQLLVWFCIIIPSLDIYNGLPPMLPALELVCVIASTVLIAAGGYVINDYEDVDIDRVNKPDKLIITKHITKDQAWTYYLVLTISGIALGAYLALAFHSFNLFFIQALSAGALWFYSTSYKKQLLVGNLIVSVLSALVVLLPGIYEIMAEAAYFKEYLFNFSLISAYAFFAFTTTLIREIVKDAEDIEGDELNECTTLPIVWGVNTAKTISIALCLIVFAGVVYVQTNRLEFHDYFTFGYFIAGVQIPLLFLIYLIIKGNDKTSFHKASTMTKLVMLGGILSMLPFSFALH